jgi:DNA-binding MarR family transcriptional regulator
MAENGENLGGLISQAAQRWQLEAARALRPAGLTYAQYQLLAALQQSPGYMQAAVARQAGIDAMTASVVLRKLERRRLVARRASNADSRALLLTLTASGSAALAQAQILMMQAEAAFFVSVGAQRRELAAVLGALAGQRVRVRVAMRRNAAG